MHHNKSHPQRDGSAPQQQQDTQRAQLLQRLSSLTHDEVNQLFDSIQHSHKSNNTATNGRHSTKPFDLQHPLLINDNDDHMSSSTESELNSAAPSSLFEGAPPEFSERKFGDRISYWIVILALLFFLLTVQQFAHTLAENAQRIQEMEFFTDGINCDHLSPEPSECVNGLAHQATVENWSKGLTIILSFTVAPVFGILSDLKGRRPLLILAMAMNFIKHLMYTLRWIAPSMITYYWIIISQVIVNSFNISATEAIITDIVPPKSRSLWLGASLAVMQLAGIVLPQVSQYLKAGEAFPSAMAFVTVTVVASIMMPETLIRKQNDESHATFAWSTLSPVRSFGMLMRYRIISMLTLGFFITDVLMVTCQALLNVPVGVIFPTSPEFQANFQSVRAGLSMFMLTAGQYLLLRFFKRKVVMVIAILSLALAIIGTATLTSITQIYCWMIPYAVVEVLPPIGLSILSSYIPPREFGTALTAIMTVASFGQAIAQQLVVPLYFWWSPVPGTHGPSAGGSMHFFPQILFSLIAFIGCFVFWNLQPPTQGEKDDYEREVKMEEEKKNMDRMTLQRSESQRNTMEMLEAAGLPVGSVDPQPLLV